MTRLLLDTHIIIWLTTDSRRVPARLQRLVANADQRYISVASFLEVALKHRKYPDEFPFSVDFLMAALVELHALELPILSAHSLRLGQLPLHHKDPFDHLLVAQAIEEDLTLISMDSAIRPYAKYGLQLAGGR